MKDYFEKNPDFFNNTEITKKKTMELDKLFDKAVSEGLLDKMIFSANSIHQGIDSRKPETAFHFSVVGKDSVYAATVFVSRVANDAIIAKFKDGKDYKLPGKMKTEKRVLPDFPNIRVEKRMLFRNKLTYIPVVIHHNIKIELKDIASVEK